MSSYDPTQTAAPRQGACAPPASAALAGEVRFNRGACGAVCANSERALREAVLQTSFDGIAIYNPRGEVVFVNGSFAAVCGYDDPAELIGKNWKTFYDEWTHDLFRKVIMPQVSSSGRWRGEVVARKADGSPYHQEVSLARLEDGRTAQAVRDISGRKEAEAELGRARDAAVEAARVKAEFLANMSHEIRTPLSGVIGMADLLLDSRLSGRQREFAEALSGSAHTLLQLINDILDFSKIEAGKLRVEAEDFDLLPVVESAVETHAPRAQARGLELASFADEDVPRRLRGDRTRLCQVLLNLVSNAVKFTERGEVFVRASLAERAGDSVLVRFEVRDTGVGVEAEALAKLFRPFSQADGSMTRKYGGTGLGLAISKQLVEMMGGDIGCETEPGRGSTFWFTARFAPPRDAADAAPEPSAATHAGARVLVVEDNPNHCRVLCRQIRSWGWRAGCAHSRDGGFDALRGAALAGEPYDLVLFDSSVAGAREAAHEIGDSPELARTRVVLMSDLSTHQFVPRPRRGREPEVLFKPLKQSQLRARLEAVLSAEGARQNATAPRRRLPVRRGKVRASKPPGGARARVLVAEDDAVIREVVRQNLLRLGYAADFVSNGREAVRAVRRSRYGLVLMDVQMPEMDGYEATAAIRRAEQGGRRTPVIAFTAHALAGHRQQCLDAGMDDYVAKPEVGETLRRVLERWLTPGVVGGVGRKSAELTPPRSAAASLELFVRPSVLRMMERGEEGREPGGVFGLYEKFCADSAAEVEGLKESAPRGDAESLRRTAHRLKGRADIFGLERLAGLCAEVERRAGEGGEWNFEEGVAAVELELALLRGAIEYERGGPA